MTKAQELIDLIEMGGYSIGLKDIKDYAFCIMNMEKARVNGNVSAYKKLDIERKKEHDKLLRKAKVDREDTKFNFWLATSVEKVLNRM